MSRHLACSMAVCLAVLAGPGAGWLAVSRPVMAQPAADVAGLMRTLQLDAVIGVLRDEGLVYGGSLREELFPGRVAGGWDDVVSGIYDAGAMRDGFEAALQQRLGDDPAALQAAEAFFGTDRGQGILTLEVEARKALLDPAVEEAAKLRMQDMVAAEDPRLAALRRFAEANDLIESNVQGGLNANLAFYKGMAEAGAFGTGMTEEQMLADVWAQEEQVRTETEDWLYPYLAMAYGSLSEKDLEDYIRFSLTPEGQRLNAALFAAFDVVFTRLSRDLGRAAAAQMAGEDI